MKDFYTIKALEIDGMLQAAEILNIKALEQTNKFIIAAFKDKKIQKIILNDLAINAKPVFRNNMMLEGITLEGGKLLLSLKESDITRPRSFFFFSPEEIKGVVTIVENVLLELENGNYSVNEKGAVIINKPKPTRLNVGEAMDSMLEKLEAIRQSGYWPYSSPAPCSTEVKIKESLDATFRNLSMAKHYHQEMFGKTKRDPMKATSSVIEDSTVKKTGKPGTLIHGTLRNEDLIPAFIEKLKELSEEQYDEFISSNPSVKDACSKLKEEGSDHWFSTEEATELCNDLIDILNTYSPDNHYFGTHPGDGSDFGWWKNE